MSLSAVLSLGTTLLEKFVPDPQEKAKHHIKLMELADKGDEREINAYVQGMLGQLAVNKVEAAHPSRFVAGWRPWIGWTAGVGLGVAFIPKALVMTVLWTTQAYMMLDGCVEAAKCDITTFVLPPFPELGMTDLIAILGAMLGIGTMRSVDKIKQVDTRRVK